MALKSNRKNKHLLIRLLIGWLPNSNNFIKWLNLVISIKLYFDNLQTRKTFWQSACLTLNEIKIFNWLYRKYLSSRSQLRNLKQVLGILLAATIYRNQSQFNVKQSVIHLRYNYTIKSRKRRYVLLFPPPMKTAVLSLPYIVCHLWYSYIEKKYKANTEHAKWKFRNRVLWTLNDPWTLESWVFLKLLYTIDIKRCNIVI